MPLPTANPYSTSEVEYREAGYDYAPQYPGSYNYNQSGIVYREAGFPYVKRDAIVSATTIGCSASLSLSFAYVYRPSSGPLIDYTTAGVSYSPVDITGFTVAAIATPSTIGVTTTFSATPSVPATVTPATIACPAIIIASVTATTITLHGGISTSATLPSASASAIATPDEVSAEATIPDESLYVTVDAKPDVVDVGATVPAPTEVSGNYTATPAVIGAGSTFPTVTMFRYLVIPTTNIVPSVGLRNEPTPAAYSLMRHFGPVLRGDNIFIIDGTTVQDYLPVDKSTVTRWIYGGHDSPTDLTDSEQTVLVSAGYSFRVGPE